MCMQFESIQHVLLLPNTQNKSNAPLNQDQPAEALCQGLIHQNWIKYMFVNPFLTDNNFISIGTRLQNFYLVQYFKLIIYGSVSIVNCCQIRRLLGRLLDPPGILNPPGPFANVCHIYKSLMFACRLKTTSFQCFYINKLTVCLLQVCLG